MNTAYVCTNYNSSQETIDAVRSFRKSCTNGLCIVVDNDSRPEQKSLLRRCLAEQPGIHLLLNDENVGYFPGLNVGLEWLYRHAPAVDVAVVGNNDLLFPENFFDQLQKNRSLFDSYPVVSPNITTIDGIKQNPHVVGDVSGLRLKMYALYFSNYHIGRVMLTLNKLIRPLTRRDDESGHGHAQEITQGHGSCYLLGPLFFHRLRLLPAPTFLFGEEFFLAAKLREIDLKTYYEPSIEVTHLYHAAVSKIPKKSHWILMRKAYLEEQKIRRAVKW